MHGTAPRMKASSTCTHCMKPIVQLVLHWMSAKQNYLAFCIFWHPQAPGNRFSAAACHLSVIPCRLSSSHSVENCTCVAGCDTSPCHQQSNAQGHAGTQPVSYAAVTAAIAAAPAGPATSPNPPLEGASSLLDEMEVICCNAWNTLESEIKGPILAAVMRAAGAAAEQLQQKVGACAAAVYL